MTVVNTTTNYTVTKSGKAVTRKVDLYVQGVMNFGSTGLQQMFPTLGVEQGGSVCAGIVKLAQKAFNTLMNYSPMYDYDWGTALTALLVAGSPALFRRDLATFMTSALEGVITQLQEQETVNTPDDERIRDFIMTDWYINRDTLLIALKVVSQKQEVTALVIPISIVP